MQPVRLPRMLGLPPAVLGRAGSIWEVLADYSRQHPREVIMGKKNKEAAELDLDASYFQSLGNSVVVFSSVVKQPAYKVLSVVYHAWGACRGTGRVYMGTRDGKRHQTDDLPMLPIEDYWNAAGIGIKHLRANLMISEVINPESVVEVMGEGFRPAMGLVVRLFSRNGITTILQLDRLNIRGKQLWVGFTDYCNAHLEKFIEAVHTEDPDLFKAIDEAGSLGAYPHQVHRGVGNVFGYGRKFLPKWDRYLK